MRSAVTATSTHIRGALCAAFWAANWAAFWAALAALPLVAGAEPLPCARACLEGRIDDYLTALVAHDPAELPLAAAPKFTENGQRLELGDGLWNTVTGRGGYGLAMADEAAGQAAWMGTIREAEKPTVLVLRLGTVDGRIAEIETLVIRDEAVARRLDEIGTPRPAFFASVPADERHTRAELVRIANLYFSGIENNDGRGDYPLAPGCARLENGTVTAGDPARVIRAPGPLARELERENRMSCLEQFESGMFYYVTRIRDRRFVVLDPERGLAFAFAFFDNASGDARYGTLRNGRPAESGPSIPWTWEIAEVFKIEQGRIGPVESVLQSVPYGMGSGWSDWADAMSSEPRWEP